MSNNIYQEIVHTISSAFNDVLELNTRATKAWQNDGVEVGASPALGQSCRRAARRLLGLADHLDAQCGICREYFVMQQRDDGAYTVVSTHDNEAHALQVANAIEDGHVMTSG